MKFINVYQEDAAPEILYALLSERTKDQSISHKEMPTFAEHIAFINSVPYHKWYLLKVGSEFVGSIYISKAMEIGVFIFRAHKGHGYGTQAVTDLMSLYPGVRFFANINPKNQASAWFFQKLGFKLIQHTYAHESTQLPE